MTRIKSVAMSRRNLAIVMLDIVGSTAFVQQVGAEKAAVWFQYHDRLARSLCYKFQGREIDRSDGFLLSFDTTLDAVDFALTYQREIPPKTRLNTRIGIHWGSIVEVTQDEVFVGAGAKRVELEGLAKNVAARTMSLCGAGQVLLTKEAMSMLRGRMSRYTPKGTRYVCVGLYRFKGIKAPQEIYAVGGSIKTLQPPQGSKKVKRLGGPKVIRSRARDRKVKEWVSWIFWKMGWLMVLWLIFMLGSILFNPRQRWIFGLEQDQPFLDSIADVFKKPFSLSGEELRDDRFKRQKDE